MSKKTASDMPDPIRRLALIGGKVKKNDSDPVLKVLANKLAQMKAWDLMTVLATVAALNKNNPHGRVLLFFSKPTTIVTYMGKDNLPKTN